ncbi:two-component system, sensor histidine kinase [Azospirillaceae bacterium]
MSDFLINFFSIKDVVPYGLYLEGYINVFMVKSVGDGIYTLCCFSITASLIYYSSHRPDPEFSRILHFFILWILCGGVSHAFSLWTLWSADDDAEAAIKIVTAVISLMTAASLWIIMPTVLALPTRSDIVRKNAEMLELNERLSETVKALDHEVIVRKQAEEVQFRLQQKLQLVLNTIPQRVFWKSLDMIYLGCNRTFAEDCGAETPEDVIGKSDFDLRWAAFAEHYRADDRRVMTSGESTINYEQPVALPSGRILWVRSSKIPLRNRGGKVIGILGTYENLTEYKESRDALRRSEEMLRTFFNRSMVGLATISAFKNWIEVNPTLCDMLGYSPQELRMMTWLELIHPEDRDRNTAQFAQLLNGEIDGYSLDERFIRKDGRIIDTFSAVAGVREETGNIEYIVGIFEDITLRKANEAELIRAKEEAEEANRTKTTFLAMMSHEIRTPMTGVIGMADFLAKSQLDKNQRLYVDTMRSSARTLLAVLNDLLDYSKVEANRLTIEAVAFDAVLLLLETSRLFWSKAQENACTISVDLGGYSVLAVKGDPIRTKQVLGNLIDNAVKFSKNGRIMIKLRQDMMENNFRLRFEIKDTGIGISESNLSKLFLPFSQAAKGTTRKYGGTGLGLAISKRLAELMGGDLTVSSTLGRGSIFCFTCLVERACLEDIVIERQQMVTVRPMTILLAEDNPTNRMIVKLGLEQRLHRVMMVENGVQAYNAAAGQRFDLILMDMQMPEMDGVEATRRIRTLPLPFSDVPIVALTADAITEHRAAYIESGLDDFLTKPVEWNKLDAVLARFDSKTSTRFSTNIVTNTNVASPAMPDNRLDMQWSSIHLEERALPIREDVSHSDKDHLINFPELTGLNVRDGLARMNNNVDAYRQTLITFAVDQVNTADKIRKLVKIGDIMSAARLAHTLKGVAGNIGATLVQRTAQDMESALNDKRDDFIEELTTSIDLELKRTVSCISIISQSDTLMSTKSISEDIAKNVENVNPAVVVNVIPQLKTLRRMLTQYDSEAVDNLALMIQNVSDTALFSFLRTLHGLIENLEFDDALKYLDHMIKPIVGTLKEDT